MANGKRAERDPTVVQQEFSLQELSPATLHDAQLAAVDYGLRNGLSVQETLDELLAPLGLTCREEVKTHA